jgi:predicted DNA-binding transcriptional regulator AlpA
MSEPSKSPTLLGDAFRQELAAIVKEVVSEAMQDGKHAMVEERLLEADEAAKVLAVTPEWLYRNRKRLPFTRKLGHKMLRFSYVGILRWIETKKLTVDQRPPSVIPYGYHDGDGAKTSQGAAGHDAKRARGGAERSLELDSANGAGRVSNNSHNRTGG